MIRYQTTMIIIWNPKKNGEWDKEILDETGTCLFRNKQNDFLFRKVVNRNMIELKEIRLYFFLLLLFSLFFCRIKFCFELVRRWISCQWWSSVFIFRNLCLLYKPWNLSHNFCFFHSLLFVTLFFHLCVSLFKCFAVFIILIITIIQFFFRPFFFTFFLF